MTSLLQSTWESIHKKKMYKVRIFFIFKEMKTTTYGNGSHLVSRNRRTTLFGKGAVLNLGTTLWPHCQSNLKMLHLFIFLSGFFLHKHSWIAGLQGKGESISLTPHYHFQPHHRHFDISQVITAESSPLHIASSQARSGNLWFPSASR